MKRLGKIKTLAVAAVATVGVAVPVALAQTAGQEGRQQRPRAEGRGGKGFGKGEGRGFGHRRGGFGRGDFGGFRGVELTAEQKTRLQQIRQSFGERTRSLHEQLRAKRQELRQAEQGGTFNEALAAQKLTESAAIEARLMAERFRLRQESLAVLTPEQRQQIEQRRQEREQRRQQRRGARGGATTTAVQ
jgi:Spy/CpxP family protein refolding chaperone